MLSRSGKDPELAHVLMGAFPNIADAWASELRRMPKGRLPGNDGDPFEDRLRKELVDRLKSVSYHPPTVSVMMRTFCGSSSRN